MKIERLFKSLLLFLLLFSCSSNSENYQEYDFSFLINKEWKRVQFNISMEFDFNLDGVTSTNMINEFECLKNASFKLSSDGRLDYNFDSLFLSTTAIDPDSPKYTEQYYCSEDGFGFFGIFEMIDESTVKIESDSIFDNIVLGTKFIATYTFIDNRLVRTYMMRHPTSYDEKNQVYNYEMIQVEEIFEHE